jgi:hypothetical protein
MAKTPVRIRSASSDNSPSTKEALKRWDVIKIPVGDLVTPDQTRHIVNDVLAAHPHLNAMAQKHAEQYEDSEQIYKLCPDLEKATDTLVSNILSPTDLKQGDLSIGIHPDAPAEMSEMVRKHFSTDEGYNLNKNLAETIKTALVKVGADVRIPIPPSAISNVIHQNTYGLESLGSTLSMTDGDDLQLPLIGYVGTGNMYKDGPIASTGLESALSDMGKALIDGDNDKRKKEIRSVNKVLQDEREALLKNAGEKPLVEITDNPGYLIYGQLKTNISEYNLDNLSANAWGLESNTPTKLNNSPGNKTGDLKEYRDHTVKLLPYIKLMFDRKDSEENNPIVLHPVASAVIPVLNPSTRKPVGFYLLTDVDGHPLRPHMYMNRFRQLSERLDRNVREQSSNVSYSFGVSYPSTNNFASTERSNAAILLSAYEELMEEELRSAILKGKTGMVVDIAKVDAVYRMMFARQLAKQRTRIIYISAEKVNYWAYNYTEEGVGESLIEKTKIYSSLRATLMYANLMGAIKSAINRTLVTVTLDDNEVDPRGTVELLLNEMAGLMSNGYPFGKYQNADIVDSLLKSGTQVQVNGGKYPNTKVELVDSKRDVTPPSQELQDYLKEIQYQGFGVSLELIEKASSIDFAAEIDSINLMQSKLMDAKRIITCVEAADFIKKYLRCGGKFYNELKATLESNKSKLTMDEFIAALTVILPTADAARHDAQYKAYQAYVTFITDAISAVVSETELTGMMKGDNIPNQIAALKEIYINELKRRYLKSRNILPELFDLINDVDGAGKSAIEEHIKTMAEAVGTYSRYAAKAEHTQDEKDKAQEDLLNPPPPEETDEGVDNGDGGENPDETTPDDGSTDDMGGGDEELPDLGDEGETPDDGTTDEETPADEGTPPEEITSDETTTGNDEDEEEAETPEKPAKGADKDIDKGNKKD